MKTKAEKQADAAEQLQLKLYQMSRQQQPQSYRLGYWLGFRIATWVVTPFLWIAGRLSKRYSVTRYRP